MRTWQLRQADSDDADGLAGCVTAAYSMYIPRMGKPPGPMLADYKDVIARHNVWVATLDSEIIGGLVLIAADDHLLLDNIAVHPDRQGMGIGRALLDLADVETARLGHRELRLYTHAMMTENVNFYARLGWEETHRGHEDGYDRVFFRRQVGA